MRNGYIAKCTKDINIDLGLPQFIFTLNVVTYIKAFTAAVA